MPTSRLPAEALRLTIDPDALGFADTSALQDQPLPWIGQERAETAVHFGLEMAQSDYNMFVLGEVGSGRSSLLRQAMQEAATRRATPPDLCYLYNFDAPERPRALRLPAGQGRLLRQGMARLVRTLLAEIPQQLDSTHAKVEGERLEKTFKEEEARAFSELDAFAETRDFALHRDAGRLLFTLRGPEGRVMTEDEMLALPKERRAKIARMEEELLVEINRYLERVRPFEQALNESLAALRRRVVRPLIDRELREIRIDLKKQIKDSVKLGAWLHRVKEDLLDGLELFQPDETDDSARREALAALVARYRVNLVVDNHDLEGAPVIVEDNPLFRSLFGSIEYQSENDVLVTDFSRIRAGSLHRAHGGFLLLHLRDLVADGLVWEKLRRFLRCGRLQIEEPGTAYAPVAAVSLEPEPVDADVKIVLIGSRELYYDLQEADPEFARHFRVKVDFAERFPASDESRRASAVFVARTCARLGLPHFSAAAVARLLEQGHREAEDRSRQSAIFGRTEALVLESATLCRLRAGRLVEAADVDAALIARTRRHDYPEEQMREAITEGEVLITLHGETVGQVNGLTVVDLGDHSFGFPTRITARTYAGEEGLVSIEREVAMSGPIHDKGVLILKHYLASLFARNTPLALNAAIVFEQEYHGIEGDSASCAELYVLLSSLAGVPLRQGLAVTGALNQHGEVLPVGGINEKIEGYFQVCAAAGLDGHQGVLMPGRNRRHLMLDRAVISAVERGLFHIHTIDLALDGLALLTGREAGTANASGAYPRTSVLGQAQQTLLAHRRAVLPMEHRRPLH
ncbi:MAG: ATP-binding protein [Desulfobulbus sp.]|jgi:predicted ATP-dependent protease|nr:ATP-binding protein [Desulfobulbus sp.]